MSDEVTVRHGDALKVLAEMDAASVDAVVTDPPYGLEFMGKEWDRLGDIGKAKNRGMSEGRFKNMTMPESYNADVNVKCAKCRKWRKDHAGRRCVCAEPEFPNFKAHQARAMQDWHYLWAAECLRLLKPGGYLLAFGGTRTAHRLTCAVEDAGFEIRDTISWLYGSGFPKSLDVSKAIDRAAGVEREVVGVRVYGDGHVQRSSADHLAPPIGTFARSQDDRIETAPATPDAEKWQGWGTALKPGFEPVVVARKPLAGTVAANVLEHGTGALNIDGCRIEGEPRTTHANGHRSTGSGDGWGMDAYEATVPAGRWPANVALDEDAAAELDRQSGVLASGANPTRRGSDKFRDAYGEFPGQEECTPARGADSGGASRFFPAFRYEAKAATHERPRVDGVAHPTVKPLDLMRWLVRLVTPPGGLVLDPFAGSGTTGEACLIEGFRCVLVENHEPYLPLIEARLSKPLQPVLGEELSA